MNSRIIERKNVKKTGHLEQENGFNPEIILFLSFEKDKLQMLQNPHQYWNNNNNNNNNNNYIFLIIEKILLTTMLAIKILFTINSLEKKKELFIQNTIYNSCRFKKHLI